MVYARSTNARLDSPAERLYPKELGRAISDGSGRFRVEIARTSSSREDSFGAVALAPGYGTGWVDGLDPDAEQPTAEISLRPEQLIHGRLFDVQGQPARDVKLSVTAIRRFVPDAPGYARDNFEGPAFWWNHPDDVAGWPKPAISDAAGRFTLHGVGPGLSVFLSVLDSRFAGQVIEIKSDAASLTKPLSFALQPARTLTGRVTYADTGKPAPNARVTVGGFDQQQPGVGARPIIATTDAEGRFSANIGTGNDGRLVAYPAEGQPYLSTMQSVELPKGAVTYSADVALARGVMVSGKVAERGSGRPVASAVVTFFPIRSADDQANFRGSFPVETATDGSFSIAVAPRRGHFVVRGAER